MSDRPEEAIESDSDIIRRLEDEKTSLQECLYKANTQNGEYWHYVNRRCSDLEPKYGLKFSDNLDTKKWAVVLKLNLLECGSRVEALAIVERMEEQLRDLVSIAESNGGGLPS